MNRRHILGSLPAASTLLNLTLANRAAADTSGDSTDRKTLLCVHLSGGMDGYHLLVPRDDSRYADYAAARSNLAHAKDDLLPLTESKPDTGGALYGLHPSCQELADMFNGSGVFENNPCLSFVSNIGSLIRPLTMEQFRSGRIGTDIPIGLAGHALQTEQWQTTLPQGTVNLRGWLGRAADLLHDCFNREKSSMNLSLGGNNLLQTGGDTRPLAYRAGGGLGLSGQDEDDPQNLLAIKNLLHRRILGEDHQAIVDRAFNEISFDSLDLQEQIKNAVESFDRNRIIKPFPSTSFGRALESALILIATREEQGLSRQSFFMTSGGGWDHHRELLAPFATQIAEVSQGVAIFYENLVALGLDDSVIGFTTSEFARTMRSTGNGTDHAWGGTQMVFGGPIKGGEVLGTFPDIALNSNDDIGRGGRFLPSLSCDEYFADALRWFGVEEEQLNIVLPNYGNFSGRDPIGYLATS